MSRGSGASVEGSELVKALVSAGVEGVELVKDLEGDGKEEQLMVRERVREAVRLEVVEGKSQKEIALEMGVSVGELRRWRGEWREYWLEAYEDAMGELEEERASALARVERRLAREADNLVTELLGMAYGGQSERVRMRALEVALRVLGGGARMKGGVQQGVFGRPNDGMGAVAAALKAVGSDVKVYIDQRKES